MAVTPEDLLSAAKAMSAGEEEVDWRNATSRAYYAAYHRCRTLAPHIGPYGGSGGGVHRQLVDELTDIKSYPRLVNGLGYMLDQCRKTRATADYDIDLSFAHADCLSIMELTESILAKANAVA